jgi:hypothetical protein
MDAPVLLQQVNDTTITASNGTQVPQSRVHTSFELRIENAQFVSWCDSDSAKSQEGERLPGPRRLTATTNTPPSTSKN